MDTDGDKLLTRDEILTWMKYNVKMHLMRAKSLSETAFRHLDKRRAGRYLCL